LGSSDCISEGDAKCVFENVKFFKIISYLVVYATDSFRICPCVLLILSISIPDVTSGILEFLVSNLDPDTG